MDDPVFVYTSTHFKDFYDKLNVISQIIKIKNDSTRAVRPDPYKILLPNNTDAKDFTTILTKEIDSELLTTSFNTRSDKKSQTISIPKKLTIGSVNESFSLTITNAVDGADGQAWFKSEYADIFKIKEESDKNINELHSSKPELSAAVASLFTFKTFYNSTTKLNMENDQYVWKSKYEMLALLDQPFLLLSFDMYYFNATGTHLFEKNLNVKQNVSTAAVSPPATAAASAPPSYSFGVDDLFTIEFFEPPQLPTFLMLLIFYAGYSFNIDKEHITSKFRNKFNQSVKKTSFQITPYVPISNTMETEYNNTVKSSIKPEKVDLEVETLQVYHVASKIASLWDYVNSKLTILINNMLNTNDRTEKDRYKTLFKKKYSLNKLFLFECIDALKKYKVYILNPANITTIEFPMSTLKTLEILILKLSYIFSLLEPTFIPLETMSFDVIMNGKTLKYVINSELQATNISIDDSTSNDKLMEAILSTRAAIIDNTADGKIKARNLLSDNSALELQKSFIQKKLDTYITEYKQQGVARARIDTKHKDLTKALAERKEFLTTNGHSPDLLEKTEVYLNLKLQHQESELENATSLHDFNIANDNIIKAKAILEALDRGAKPDSLADLFAKLKKNDYAGFDKATLAIESLKETILQTKNSLVAARAQTPRVKKELERTAEENKKVLATVTSSSSKKTEAEKLADGIIEAFVEVTQANISRPVIDWRGNTTTKTTKLRLGLSFGIYGYIYYGDYEIGKIISVNDSKDGGFPNSFKVKNIAAGYVLTKIQEVVPTAPVVGAPAADDIYIDIWPVDIVEAERRQIFEQIKTDSERVTSKDNLRSTIKINYDTSIADDKQTGNVDKLIKFQKLLDVLDKKLEDGKTYKFTFRIPRETSKKRQTGDPFSGGGKNTTKKVNRKQRQRKSKTKKVFES